MDESEICDYCHQKKAHFWIDEVVKRKVGDVFGEEQTNAVMSILNSGEKIYPRLQLAMLKVCDGTIESLKRLVKVADEDERDILMIEYLHQVEHDPNFSLKENIEAQKRDLEDYLRWVDPKHFE